MLAQERGTIKRHRYRIARPARRAAWLRLFFVARRVPRPPSWLAALQ